MIVSARPNQVCAAPNKCASKASRCLSKWSALRYSRCASTLLVVVANQLTQPRVLLQPGVGGQLARRRGRPPITLPSAAAICGGLKPRAASLSSNPSWRTAASATCSTPTVRGRTCSSVLRSTSAKRAAPAPAALCVPAFAPAGLGPVDAPPVVPRNAKPRSRQFPKASMRQNEPWPCSRFDPCRQHRPFGLVQLELATQIE